MGNSFAEFVATRSNRLLRVAYLLTRDWALAEDLLQTSLAKTWTAWRRIEGDPEPYVRRVLVNTHTSWWRRRWNGERPASELPERPAADSHREPLGTARLAAVTERVHQRRLQKVTAVVAACAVVLAAILGYAMSPARRSAPQPATTPSPELVNGFPRFQMGTRLAATTTLTAARPDARLDWQATTTDLKFFVRCTSASTDVTVFLTFRVGTERLGEVGCQGTPDGRGGAGTGASGPPSVLAKAGLLAGSAVQLRVARALSSSSSASVPVPADFAADVAVGEAVPFDAYPFPPRPSTLPEAFATGIGGEPDAVRVDADPADPLRPMTLEFAWGDWKVESILDAPGRLASSVNGQEFSECDKWDYSLDGCGDFVGPNNDRLKDLHLRRGERVTLTVTPRRAMHAWQVWLIPERASAP